MSTKVCFEYQLHWPTTARPDTERTERYRLVVAADSDDGDGPSATMTLLLEVPGPTGDPQWVDISGGSSAHRLMAPVLLRMFAWGSGVGTSKPQIRENAHGVRFINLGLLNYEEAK